MITEIRLFLSGIDENARDIMKIHLFLHSSVHPSSKSEVFVLLYLIEIFFTQGRTNID